MMKVNIIGDNSWLRRKMLLVSLICLVVLLSYVWINKPPVAIDSAPVCNSLIKGNVSSTTEPIVTDKGFTQAQSIVEARSSAALDRYENSNANQVGGFERRVISNGQIQYPQLRTVSENSDYLLSKLSTNSDLPSHYRLLVDQERTWLLSYKSSIGRNNTNANSNDTIPNIVHYIWCGDIRNFTFINYLSFVSVDKFIKPDYIFLHGDCLPHDGYWWNRTKEEVANIYFVNTTCPKRAPNGPKLRFLEHSSDLIRIHTLLDYGGIYLDTDVLALKSFDPLKHFRYVMGRVLPTDINSGIILSRKGEPFLSIWLEVYSSYLGDSESYSEKATTVPYRLAQLFPHLIHVEENSMNQPTWLQEGMRLLYLEQYDWSNSYAVHVWHRYLPDGAKVPQSPSDVQNLNTTIGQIVRYILNE